MTKPGKKTRSRSKRARRIVRLSPRQITTLLITVGTVASVVYAFATTGLSQATTEARCRAGAFTYHSVGKTHSEADTIPSNAPVGGLAAIAPGTTTLTGPNLIANGGFETKGDDGPKGWTQGFGGGTKASFSTVPGYNSATAARVAVAEYQAGNPADWFPAIVDVKPGGYYQYHDNFRSTIATRVTLMTEDRAGQRAYTELVNAAANSHWTEYTATFFIPDDVVHARISHQLAGAGLLEVDNVSLRQANPQGFDRALVSVTFDDGWRSIHDDALPLLNRYEIPTTQYLISGYLGQAKDYMKPSDVYDLRDHGHEIASHTVDHLNLAPEPKDKVEFELGTSAKNLNKCYTNVTNFASPYGTYSATATSVAKGLYQTYRSTDTGFNTADNFDAYHLTVQNVDADTSLDQIRAWLRTAAANRAWLILVYHQVDNSSSSYARKPAVFEQDLQVIKASGVAAKTVAGAYAEIKPQLEK